MSTKIKVFDYQKKKSRSLLRPLFFVFMLKIKCIQVAMEKVHNSSKDLQSGSKTKYMCILVQAYN
jgi:hypothetical protein